MCLVTAEFLHLRICQCLNIHIKKLNKDVGYSLQVNSVLQDCLSRLC